MAQKTLIQIAQSLASELGIPVPQTVVASADVGTQKMLAFIRATGEDLTNEMDWQMLQTRSTFTTIQGQETYSFPTDIKRFISGSFFDQNNRWPMQGPLTATEWEQLKVSNLNTTPFERYRVFGGSIHLYPLPGATTFTFVFEYVSNSYIKTSGGVPANDFTQDSDISLFDHRLMIYGAKLKWLAAINMDTTNALVDYNRALEFMKGQDTPGRTLSLTGPTSGVALLSALNIPDTGFGA